MTSTGPPGPRDAARRKADTLIKLSTPGVDVWVATAAADQGSVGPHLVPLSLAWLDDRIVLALESTSRTARNVLRQRQTRLGLGPTRDVVLIDAVLERSVPVEDAPARLADGYAGQADWDPRSTSGGYVYLVLRPVRIQAWREVDELAGRTLMRAGSWLV